MLMKGCTLAFGIDHLIMAALDDLYSLLESLDVRVFSSFVLLGDFNINFYNRQHLLFCKLSTISYSFVLKQVITQPTYFSPSGNSSLIDLVLCLFHHN